MTVEAVRRLVDSAVPFVPEDAPEERSPLRPVAGDVFLRAFRVPDPLIDGLIPRGQLYAFTGPTGHGKTAIAVLMQFCIANGLPFAGREVETGAVLVLAGENPDDFAMRLLATAQALHLKPSDARRIFVIPGAFAIGAAVAELTEQVRCIGPLAAIFVDTSAAFFGGADENGNVEMRAHASHLRALCELPGRPAVVVLCHPTKNPSRDNLLPRGGGAFLAEVDGNLTAWRDDKLVTLHWGGKLRGPGFEPLTFELVSQRLAVTDSKGREVSSVAAVPATGERTEQLEQAALTDENRMLAAMRNKPGGSVAELAQAAGFANAAGVPQKSRAHRLIGQLAAQGLARKTRAGRWQLTDRGKTEAAEVPV